ncbi:unnamed protein product [Lymnaea stagnalis]|uniref:G-protein coupled receptors family 1 profile domain-containing protein n=1 Tax=Lymnaea stagnalis TaxID=6523 RepID=A0AAV2HUB1_LYMST
METRDILYITAEIFVGLLSVFGNSIVVAAIWRTRRLHTITNTFVGNLAVADIVVGVLVAPCAALSFKGLPRNFYGCVFINSVILIVTNISILMLLAVALERFLAIKEPFVYQRLLTVRRGIYINLGIWVLGFLLGLVPMYGWNHGYHELTECQFTEVITYEYMVYFQFFGLVLLPLFLMMCIYIYILIIVRRHMRQTNALRTLFHHQQRSHDGFNKDVKAAKMLALVILFFGIFWLPVNIFNSLELFCKDTCKYPYPVLLAAIVMSHANSCINPFLYAASNSRIKRAIKEMFGFKTRPEDFSTDQNHLRHTNGLSHGREVIGNPPSDPSVNASDPHQPFVISQDDFLKVCEKVASDDAHPMVVCVEDADPAVQTLSNADVVEIVQGSSHPTVEHTQNYSEAENVQPNTPINGGASLQTAAGSDESSGVVTKATFQTSKSAPPLTVTLTHCKDSAKNGFHRSFHIHNHRQVSPAPLDITLTDSSPAPLANGHVNFAYERDDSAKKLAQIGGETPDTQEADNEVRAFTTELDAPSPDLDVVVIPPVSHPNGHPRSWADRRSPSYKEGCEHNSLERFIEFHREIKSLDYAADIDAADTGGQFTKVFFRRHFQDGRALLSAPFPEEILELKEVNGGTRHIDSCSGIDAKRKTYKHFIIDLDENGLLRNAITEHTKL